MNLKFSFLALFALAVSSFAATTSTSSPSSVTVTVGTCAGATYTTISKAVAAVPAGSTIKVCPGIYYEEVTISKSLTLTGITSGNSENPIIELPSTPVANSTRLLDGSSQFVQILVSKCANVTISNIIVDGTNSMTSCGPDLVGIKYSLSSGTINHVVTRNQALSAALNGCLSGEGIVAESAPTVSGSTSLTITNSSIHNYQVDGITAEGVNTTVNTQSNFVAGQGPTTGVVENGIEYIAGAKGSITSNIVVNNIYSPANYGATGILIDAAEGITVSGNAVGDSQFPIVLYTDPSLPYPGNPNGLADKNIVTNNVLTNTPFDGIDACSNSNTITGNTIVNAGNSGVHLDSACGSTGEKNTVSNNTINDACAAIAEGATPNSIGTNTTFNVQSIVLANNSCNPVTPALLEITSNVQVQTARVTPQWH